MSKRRTILTSGVVVLLLVGGGLGWIVARSHKPQTLIGNKTITNSTARPSEAAVTAADYTWQGSSEQPKYINLPSLNTGGYIEKMGVDQHHDIAVPTDIHLAGWFVNSVKPGQPGLSIILGHINGRTSSDGIFRNLAKLKPNDSFTVTLGSGKQLSYQIMSVNNYDDATAANYLYSQSPNVKSQLNLITCGGEFNYQAHEYNQRTIVSAKLLSS